VNEPTVADTSAGRAEIQFGINRWVLVTIGSDTGQERLGSAHELADYLRRRGLIENEARDLARAAWHKRPRDADAHAASADESLVAATGLSSGTVLLLVAAFVAVVTIIALYAISHWPESLG
jgi:hypothetical protein